MNFVIIDIASRPLIFFFFWKKTKVKNNHSHKKLSWAAWIIARLGGWKGNHKQRPPGPITIKKGVEKFDLIFQGWKLARQIT